MDQTGFFDFFQFGDGLFLGEVVATAGADVIVCRLIELHAGVFVRMVTADTGQSSGSTAGAVRDGIPFCVVDERQDILILQDLLLRVDLVHDGGDLHEAAALDVCETKQGAQLPVERIAEQLRDLRVLDRIGVRHDELIKARDERGNMVEEFSVFGGMLEQQALLRHMFQHRRRFFHRDAGRLRDFFDRSGFIFDMEAQKRFFFRDQELEHFCEVAVFADGT